MSEYIDRDAFEQELSGMEEAYNMVIDLLNSQPTVDAAPVIRCKDCRYFDETTVNSNGFLICGIGDMEITPTDFCSYAEKVERKEDTK